MISIVIYKSIDLNSDQHCGLIIYVCCSNWASPNVRVEELLHCHVTFLTQFGAISLEHRQVMTARHWSTTITVM